MTKVDARTAGLARRQLIVAIVCAVVIVAAGVFITFYMVHGGVFEGNWQCLRCEHIFSRDTFEPSPIECPKCGGQAVNLIYRKCPRCGKANLVWRLRLTESAQAYLAELRSRSPDGFVSFEVIAHLPNEVQYRIREPNGTYTWDQDWLSPTSPEAKDIRAGLQCAKCGEQLFENRR